MTTKAGHASAIITVFIWGLTFIVTKILLTDFSPLEIIVIRFVIALAALSLYKPALPKRICWKQEVWYILAGITGMPLYYLLENYALSYTLSANVGIIIATVPLFTGLLALLLYRDKDAARWQFFAGFAIAFVGICLISLNGSRLKMNPLGDGLTLLAALSWAAYNLILKKIESFGNDNVQNTKHIFVWGTGITVMLAVLMGVSPNCTALIKPGNLCLLLFLGIGACGICYLLWNYAVFVLGPVKTNIYLYLEPVITLAASMLFLKEPVTAMELTGIALILAGLIVSRR